MNRKNLTGNRGTNAALNVLLAALIAFAASACVYIPTPGHNLVGSRAVNSSGLISGFKAHETSRADVLIALGRPSQRRENDRFFIYVGRQIEGYLFIGAGPGGGAISHERWRIVGIEFTPDDRFLRSKAFGDSSKADAWRELDAWMTGTEPEKTESSDVESDKEKRS